MTGSTGLAEMSARRRRWAGEVEKPRGSLSDAVRDPRRVSLAVAVAFALLAGARPGVAEPAPAAIIAAKPVAAAASPAASASAGTSATKSPAAEAPRPADMAAGEGTNGAPDAGALTLRFNIPEQPLPSALQAFSAASGVAVLYRAEVGSAFRAPAVVGEFTREAALRLLLSDSDLLVRYARADAITLVDPSAAAAADTPESVLGGADLVLDTLHVATPASAPGPDRAALAAYFDAIQQEVHRALQKSRVAPGVGFQVEVDLWVEPNRVIRRAQVSRSTGDRARDAIVATTLEGLTLRQSPPARTQNPIRVKIVVTGS